MLKDFSVYESDSMIFPKGNSPCAPLNAKYSVIPLSYDMFIGMGDNKTVFEHPFDKSLLIKMLYNFDDHDWRRELIYRRYLKKHGVTSKMIPAYYGPVSTTLGPGLLFEYVRDYDGKGSRTIADCFSGDSPVSLYKLLDEFRSELFEEKVIISGTKPENFLVQRISPGKICIKIIDDLGTPAAIPILYYSSILKRFYVRKFWKSFLKKLQMRFPDVINAEFISNYKSNFPQ